MQTEEQKEFRKYKITACKYDLYSWAVFEQNKPRITGLSQREVPYYKRQILEMVKEGAKGEK